MDIQKGKKDMDTSKKYEEFPFVDGEFADDYFDSYTGAPRDRFQGIPDQNDFEYQQSLYEER